jgi:hypothetical protein
MNHVLSLQGMTIENGPEADGVMDSSQSIKCGSSASLVNCN